MNFQNEVKQLQEGEADATRGPVLWNKVKEILAKLQTPKKTSVYQTEPVGEFYLPDGVRDKHFTKQEQYWLRRMIPNNKTISFMSNQMFK